MLTFIVKLVAGASNVKKCMTKEKQMQINTLSKLPLFSLLFISCAAMADSSGIPVEAGIIDAFKTLKMSVYAILLVSALAGTFLYLFRHQRYLSWDKLSGLALALVLTFGLYAATSQVVLDDTAKVCWVITDANDSLMPPCAQGREDLANVLGIKSAYVAIWPRQVLEQGMPEPIRPIAIKFMLYGSLLLGVLGLYALFQWLAKKFLT